MIDIISGVVVLLLVILAIRYIRKAKKNGAACIGCSSGNCHCADKKQEDSACCCCHEKE